MSRLPAGADVGPHGVSIGVMSKSFALAGLRIGWLATHDSRLLDAAARVQGLHDDLRLRAGRDPVAGGAAGEGPRARPFAGDRGREPRPPRRLLRTPRTPLRVGPPRRRQHRVPRAAKWRADRPLHPGPDRGGGGAAGARLHLRARGQPLPDRLRPRGHAGCAGETRSVRGPHPRSSDGTTGRAGRTRPTGGQRRRPSRDPGTTGPSKGPLRPSGDGCAARHPLGAPSMAAPSARSH